jgi:sec-independent protein translocase protein TatA
MFGLGGPELMIVLVILLVLFGGAKIPQLMRGLGEGMREFRKATEDEEPKAQTPVVPPTDSTRSDATRL